MLSRKSFFPLTISSGNGNILTIGGKGTPKEDQKPTKPQAREGYEDPFFSAFNAYQPLKHNLDLFANIREGIPIADVAMLKIAKLVGEIYFKAEDKTVQTFLDDFKKKIRVNWFGQGLMNWISEMIDSALETGMGWGEAVPYRALNGIHRLKTCRAKDFKFVKKDDGTLTAACYKENSFQPIPIENMDLIYYLAFDQRQGHPQGYSLLYSCVYLAQVFIRTMKSFENQVMRFGNISLLGIFEGGETQGATEVNNTRESFLTQCENIFQLKKRGQTADIGISIPHGGKGKVNTLGADAKLSSTKDEIRTCLEQLIAKFSLTPYSLGLSWSVSERMSQMQADMMQADTKKRRMKLEPIIERVVSLALALEGYAGAKWEKEWSDPLLLDESEQAKAKLYNAQALAKNLESLAFLLEWELTDEQFVEDYINDEFPMKKSIKLEKDWWLKAKKKNWLKQTAQDLMKAA